MAIGTRRYRTVVMSERVPLGRGGIEPTGVPIAQHTVGHSGAGIGPGSDCPTRPEIDIVRVSNDNQRISNVVVGKNHDHSRQLT